MAPSSNEVRRADVSGTGLEPAGFGPRLGALLIDWLLCQLVGGLFVSPMEQPWLVVLVLVLTNTFFIGLFGQTVGMRLFRIRCVSIPDGGVLGLYRALIRAVLLGLFIPAMIMDGDGRGLHDRAIDSLVTRPRQTPGPR
ncbi:RDD family protein [Actinoplanes sp. NBRC 101535]|uniref:RDD family protein n=1 Tax=Actinoplanes sp. NBRC 101535 TaxID=3032196 RepID=UPI002556EDF2|nr:RDD family protein [Actinoplanes sp. NBRC 101535]